jgi:putative DNA primase/helicase
MGTRMSPYYGPMITAEGRGRRVLVLNEQARGAELDDGHFKSLVSKDEQSGRRMRRNLEQFQPTAKVVLLTNNLPRIRDQTGGTWRRIAVVRHPRAFCLDRDLEPQLRAEVPGILRRLVEACLVWQRRPLTTAMPKAIVDQVDAYRRAQDPVTDFIEAMCVVDGKQWVARSTLWNAYRQWARINLNPRERLGQHDFNDEMRRRFHERKSGVWGFDGISLH